MAEGLRLLVILTALASADPPTIPVGAPLQPADAVARALVVSPGLRASLHDLLASKAARVAQERVRRPTFRASADGVGQESFAATAVGVVRNESTQVQGGVGIDFLTDIGTTVSLEASARLEWRQVNRDPSTTMLFSIGPNYDARLELSLRQPLLRGAGSDVNLVEERSARAAEWRNVAAREEAVSQAVLDVLSSYWELWYAERARDVQSEGQRLAQQQRDEARAKLD
ncbi:MAG: TolC family protein, partial [Myxococcota bacterium]